MLKPTGRKKKTRWGWYLYEAIRSRDRKRIWFSIPDEADALEEKKRRTGK